MYALWMLKGYTLCGCVTVTSAVIRLYSTASSNLSLCIVMVQCMEMVYLVCLLAM